ncbi:hypothetical protein BpHYR1_002848 [Brachionus plicatilis]|uniref:Uncharacterized protein n=1 Tax=Brachionus plicatilis TaxID=10195 RepID=A0A3M7SF12_BRAPC|nr:hypothetical protein BpHYR1_002848 [Brachionus plicatilis]
MKNKPILIENVENMFAVGFEDKTIKIFKIYVYSLIGHKKRLRYLNYDQTNNKLISSCSKSKITWMIPNKSNMNGHKEIFWSMQKSEKKVHNLAKKLRSKKKSNTETQKKITDYFNP